MPGTPEISLYDATLGVSKNALHTLLHLIAKAQAHPDAADLASARLYPDMLPFTFQVQTVSNFAKKSVERLTSLPDAAAEVWADDETTFEQLIARIHKTLALIEKVKPEDLDVSRQVTFERFGPEKRPHEATALQYVLGYALPNTLFHLTTAYDILRSRGVEVGKSDFLKYFVADFKPLD